MFNIGLKVSIFISIGKERDLRLVLMGLLNYVTPQAGEAINLKSSWPVVTIYGTEKLC